MTSLNRDQRDLACSRLVGRAGGVALPLNSDLGGIIPGVRGLVGGVAMPGARGFGGGLHHLLVDHRGSVPSGDQITDQQAGGFQIGGDERALLGQIDRHIAGELAFAELSVEVGDPPHLAILDHVAADRERRDLRQVGSGESQQLGDVLALRLDLKIELVQRLGSADLAV